MREPTLDDVLPIEKVALMVEGIVVRPCQYVTHVPWVWWNDTRRAVCGVCHPPVNERHKNPRPPASLRGTTNE